MTRKFSCILNLAFLLVACLAPRPAPAVDWPQRTITLIQPFGAGGVTDRIGRVLAEYLSQELGVPVIVETRPGAGGALGSSQVARALPDGYTLLVSGLASQVTSPLVTPNPNLDTLRSFTHIAYLGGPPIVWAVPPSTDMKSVANVVAAVKAGVVTSYASPGVGTLGHLAAELVSLRAGIEINHIPYNNQTLADVISGRVLLASTSWGTALGHIQGKTLRPVGVTSEARLKTAPDLPTFGNRAMTWQLRRGQPSLGRRDCLPKSSRVSVGWLRNSCGVLNP